eukprot:14183640-Heterocapsa_arctica.AAC.1
MQRAKHGGRILKTRMTGICMAKCQRLTGNVLAHEKRLTSNQYPARRSCCTQSIRVFGKESMSSDYKID